MMAWGGRSRWVAVAVVIALFSGCADHHAEHQRFDDISRWVERFEDPKRLAWQLPDEVVSRLGLRAGDTVADIGAGTGYFTRRFADAVGPEGLALGLDTEPGMIAYMERDAERLGLGNYRARLVAPDDPGLHAGSTDVIFICNTVHHIENRVVYLRRLVPALRPDGRVVVVDFHDRKLPVGPRHGKISRAQMIRDFAQAGLQMTRTHDFLPYQYFLEFQP